jgi:Signal peptidase, peptidase S26
MAQGVAHRTAVTGMTTADFGGDDLGGTSGRAAGGPLAARKAPPSRRRVLAGWAITLALALLLTFGIRAFVFQAFSIPTTSMVPTLDVGDRILVQKAFFNWHQLREGDIVVFSHPPRDHCPGPAGTDLVKRSLLLTGYRGAGRPQVGQCHSPRAAHLASADGRSGS